MARQLVKKEKWLAYIMCLAWATAWAPIALGQSVSTAPIRVESNEIRVPLLVLDKKRLDQIHHMDTVTFIEEANAPNSRLLESLAVRGLLAKDFQVLEDGREQRIERVTPELGSDTSGRPGVGEERLAFPDVPRGAEFGSVHLPVWPGYLVSYAPPPSPEGSCHQVTVKVSRLDLLVYARPEYCNTRHSANDELNGTKLGRQMEADLGSKKEGNIGLSLVAFPSFRGTAMAETDIVLESPSKSMRLRDCTQLPKIGVLGIVYANDGTLVARFSGTIFPDLKSVPVLAPDVYGSCVLSGPNRYKTRLDLAPGEYKLRAVLREGREFGRAEAPFVVEAYEGEHLAVSGIVLARRYVDVGGSQDDHAAAPGKYMPLVSNGFEVVPRVETNFEKGEPFNFYFEIYHPQQTGSAATTVEAHLRIVDAKTGRVMKSLQPANATPYAKPGDPVIPIGGGIDIGSLPSGSYRLEVQATDSIGASTAWRGMNFTVE